ncbi:hypothetical protein R6Q59_034776 [Mikania micrantha]
MLRHLVAEQPVAVEEETHPKVQQAAEQPVAEIPAGEQRADPPKRRGPNINHSVARTLHNFPEDTIIPLTMDKETKTFVGTSAAKFATECGIVIRNVCPMNFHTWDSVPKEVKTLMYEKLEGSFELLRADNVFMEYVDARLRAQWKRTRGVLSQHWKKNGGKTNPLVARSNMKPDCRSEEDWNHLCNYWELEKTRKYSDKMEANRAKQVNISRGGSRSISNHVFQMHTRILSKYQHYIKLTDKSQDSIAPSPLQVYYRLHYNVKKQGWLNDHSRIEYENILEHKKAAVEKLALEGTVITTTIEYNIEKEAINSVCGKQKTLQSAWQVGVGPVLRKKDSWMNTSVQSSHQDSSHTNEDLKNQVIALKKELEHSNDKYQRMSEFISTKFPEFANIISTPVTDEATDSEGPSDDSYHTT